MDSMSKTTSPITIVVPCYNEADRFKHEDWDSLVRHERIHLCLVNDGSNDKTLSVLNDFAAKHPESVTVHHLEINQGKAEAVRQGLNIALESNPTLVGYADADMATPSVELWRLIDALEASDAASAIGARIARLGSQIQRKKTRHYLGRVFATAASLSLKAVVYDTQCGAKFFRATDVLRNIISSPFQSRWAFDVELIGRLLSQDQDIIEIPLRQWRDVAGSKLRLRHIAIAGVDLVKIAIATRRSKSQ